LADGQSESASAGATTSGGIDSIEAIEDSWQMFCGDATAGILNDDLSIVAGSEQLNGNVSPGWCVLQSIVKQIQWDLSKKAWSSGDGKWVFGGFAVEFHTGG
jgi:hypothetical protein